MVDINNITSLVDKLVEQTDLYTKALSDGTQSSTLSVIKQNIQQLQAAIRKLNNEAKQLEG